jgi:hypothetical protein
MSLAEVLSVRCPEIPFSGMVTAEDGDPVCLIDGTKVRVWQSNVYKLYIGPEEQIQSFESFEDLVTALKKLLGNG